MPTISLKRPLTPEQIDNRAATYNALDKVKSAAAKNVSDEKDLLVELCRAFGVKPEAAEKSLRLEGNLWVITASFGSTSKINALRLAKFQGEMLAANKSRLLRSIFTQTITYTVAPTAAETVKALPKSLQTMFRNCFETEPKAPSLKVEKKKSKKGRK